MADLEKAVATQLEVLDGWGECEWVAKKSYIGYRRKKQFAMIGPASILESS